MNTPTSESQLSPEQTSPDIDIEQLIYDIAEHARDEDFTQLYQSLLSKELFIPVEKESLGRIPQHLKPGETLQTDGDDGIKIRNVEGPRGEPFVPIATTESAPILAEAHLGIYWLDALAMVLKVEEPAGILLQGKNSWVCFYKPQIENILKKYGQGKPRQS